MRVCGCERVCVRVCVVVIVCVCVRAYVCVCVCTGPCLRHTPPSPYARASVGVCARVCERSHSRAPAYARTHVGRRTGFHAWLRACVRVGSVVSISKGFMRA